ncbi:hypothetical protein [Candidatus Igneacidithiobacillus taiwanensis]|uniref:hypothetical protein n=1 Tax=Candidatus Igneacidithiobacillus taiwanensis TaxID=1945924 RepID=UPI0028A1BB69|nr:hypothetical protein [Candidatus Igneacidithiobacillus taiwanensis]
MKIKDDVEFIRKEFEKVGFTARNIELRWVGKECVVEDDAGMGGVLCRFSDGTRAWFPKSCVADESEEPMQILPDGTIASVKTLRDEFAMATLSGYLASFPDDANIKPEHMRNIAEFCYLMSDAMLEARKK